MKHLLTTAVLSVGFATSAVAATLSDQFERIVVFGDSLSDTGNLFGTIGFPPAPYVDGRFSNGPVWAEVIAGDLTDMPIGTLNMPALGGTVGGNVNLAFGGARADNDPNAGGPIPSVQTQIGIFLGSGGSFGSDDLVAYWAGANDIFQDLPTGVPEDVGANTAADSVANVQTLAAADAKNILVFNLPDFGTVPRYTNPANPLDDEASEAIEKYNADLGAALTAFDISRPDVTIYQVDVFSIFNDVIGDPTAFGFDNVTEACLLVFDCATGTTEEQNKFLFFDDIHPTASAHTLLAEHALAAIENELSAVPLPASAPMMLVGLGLLGWSARRNRTAA